MPEQLVVSARHLGALALPSYCARCAWLYHRVERKPPWNTFPAIFGHLDIAQKNYVTAYLDRYGRLPPWLMDLGDVVGYVPSPSMKDFYFVDEAVNVKVRGCADIILQKRDGTLLIADFKTAFPKGDDDPLAAEYKVQLNAYAKAADRLGLPAVTGIALIYMPPLTSREVMAREENTRDDGFAVPFLAQVHWLALDGANTAALCRTFRELSEATTPPAGRVGCENCKAIDRLILNAKTPAQAIASIKRQTGRELYAAAFPLEQR